MKKLLGQRPYLCALLAFTLALVGISVTAETAAAHTRVELGPYVVIVGWEIEPPIVGERNQLTVEIAEGGTPITGAEAGLAVELLYAGRSFRSNLTPTATPGTYHVEILPTVRGQYSVRLFGTLGDLEIDETLDPEPVFAADRLQFPETQPEPRELMQRLDELENDLQTARSLALAGVVIGVLGLITAVFTLWSRRPNRLSEK
ncbi:MAG: hypothetical protein R6X32_14065 [Chloroflexota bacterium]